MGRPSDYGTLPVKRMSGRKREVVAWARQLAMRGHVVGADGNLSTRRDPHGMPITPTRVAYDLLSPDQVCRVSFSDGAALGSCAPSSEWRLHAAVYLARGDVEAVVHAHPVHASALAVNREPLPQVLDEVGAILGGPVAVAEYAPSGSAALGEAVVAALGPRQAALVANHGTVTVGRDLAEAFYRLEVLERAARVYLLARLAGSPVVLD